MIITIEKIWEHFANKYQAVNVASLEARKLKDMQSKGLADTNVRPIIEALRKLIIGKIKFKL